MTRKQDYYSNPVPGFYFLVDLQKYVCTKLWHDYIYIYIYDKTTNTSKLRKTIFDFLK